MKKWFLVLLIGVLPILSIADDETLWIDVRTVGEYQSGHLPQAININYTDIGREIGQHATSKDQPIKLYCAVGGRAGIAKGVLEEMGYTNVTNEGGYKDLVDK